ncbi:MAG: calcium-binding EGF-like domain-containing protein [Chitinophagaceae bacterium]|nr:calcium-binding EGF-like domain-containing protein [Chitinophagaceae bacterium]
MRRISIILSTTVLFLMLASTVVFNACVKDPCKDIICRNNGICRDGRCKCATGFEGPNCSVKMYEKFIGTWDGSYRCNGLIPETMTLIVAPETEPNKISIYNIFSQTVAILAVVDIDKVTIPEQTLGNITYSGNGYIESKYITLYITQRDNITGNYNSCVYNGTKFTQP